MNQLVFPLGAFALAIYFWPLFGQALRARRTGTWDGVRHGYWARRVVRHDDPELFMEKVFFGFIATILTLIGALFGAVSLLGYLGLVALPVTFGA